MAPSPSCSLKAIRKRSSLSPSQGTSLTSQYSTGYGHHGDYVFGWEGDALQRAMDTCTDINGVPDQCRALTTQSDADMNRCTQQPAVNERTEGECTFLSLLLAFIHYSTCSCVDLAQLPGCNPIQNGPATATPINNCQAVSTTGIGGPVVTNPPPVSSQPPVITQPPASTQPSGPMQTRYGQCGGYVLHLLFIHVQ